MSRWYRLIAERPGWVLLGVLAFTAFCLAGLLDLRTGKLRLGIDPSAEGLLPGSGPERELFDRARRLFGSDEALIVALGADDLFQSDALERVKKLTRRIEKLDGVQNVLSLATAVNVRSQDGDIVVGPLLESVPRDPEGLRRLREEVLANPLYAGNLISRDGDATALVISIVRMSDRELIERGIDAAIVQAAHEEAGPLEVWVSGIPHVKTYLGTSLLRELSIMLPGIVLVLGVVAFIALRTVRGVLLPLATIGVALVGTLGMLGWLGQSLNLVTTTVPALILIMGFTEGMHVVAEFYAELAEGEHTGHPVTPGEAVARCLGSVGTPVLACAVTTAVGFLSLAWSPVPAVREWGLFSLLGVTYTSIVSLVFTPAVLALLPAPPRIPRGGAEGRLERLAEPIAAFAIRHRRAVLAVAFTLIALAALGATRIRVAAEFPGSLDPASPIRRDYEAINARLGGANEMRVLVESDLPGAFLEPASLEALRSLQQWLEAQPEVGDSVSIADYVMLLNAALAGKPVAEASLPGTRSLTSQLLLFGASPETKRFIDARHQTANVLVRVKVGDSDATSALVERIQARLAELPNYLHASVTGSSVLVNRVVDDLARSQGSGLAGGLFLIYLVLAFFFQSPLIGAVALIPNALPIALYFGVLGWTGITLNPTTSLVGSLALGICCDDTIHYFARLNTEARRLHDQSRAIVTTLRALIRPMAFATVGLCLGFLVLTASEQRGQAEFALLAAFTIFAAGAIELTVSPALSARLKIVTLWDVLSLDLGPAPEREIPLFEGLSLRQARVFTLMSDVRRLVPGERLLTEGEGGDDMFVVLDGELEVWVERDGARVELNRLSRGATVGEVGYFALKRTATVAARTNATLIRFDSEDLDRLRRRYPWIAALVYRNLNKTQAARMVDTTRRLRS